MSCLSCLVRPLSGAVLGALCATLLAATAMPAAAAKKQPLTPQPVERTGSGTAFDGTGLNPNNPF